MTSTPGSFSVRDISSTSDASSIDFVLLCKSNNSRMIANLLQILSYKKDQLVTVSVRPNGIKFTVEESQIMQGTAFIQEKLWQEYQYKKSEDEVFTINLSVLLDCLNIYGAGSLSHQSFPGIQVAYRGYGTPFLVMLEDNDVLTDCALRTLEAENITSFNLHNSEVVCKFVMKSESLRDAFNELDWSNTSCSWLLSDEAPYFRLACDSSESSCQVDYPKDSQVFERFECARPIEFFYKMKHLQPSVKALVYAKKTQVRVYANGLLSMQHMIQHVDGTVSFVDFYNMPIDQSDEVYDF